MPYNRLQGLRGLQGLSGLSEQEKEAWYRNNADLLPNRNKIKPAAFDKIADRVYRNQLFAKEFKGSKDFDYEQLKGLSPETRDNLYKESLVNRNFLNSFSNDEDFNSLNKELDTQGKLDLLQSGYIGSIERKKHLKQGIKAAQKVAKDFDVAMSNPFLDIMGANYMQAGKAAANEYPQEVYESESNKDKELREKLYAETQKRREEENSEQSNALWQQWVQEDTLGKSKLSQYYNAFELMASNPKISPHYAAFKDSNWLKDYSYTDKIKDYAKYQVLKAQYGEGIANRYLDRSIQNRIAEAQDGKWTGNTLKGVLTTAWSDLGSNVALFAHAGDFLNAERMGIWNQGKDPDKPLDKDGNITYDPKKIVDYAKNDSWWTNPAYWNNVYKYNTFSPEEIKTIEERGGIAEDTNIREYGYTPDFFSWDTAEEGFKQGGHVVAGVVETGLTGGAGKAIGWGGKAILKGIGLSAKAMKTASKVGAITNDIMVTATTGLEGSQLEAMGTFDEQMQSAKEKIQDQINHELKQYQDSIDYNSKEARQAINGYFNELKKRDQRRVASVKGEGVKALPLSDETLKAQAKRIYESQLMGQKEKELENLHKKDILEASKIAAQAYTANFIMDYIKNIPLTTAIQKYKTAKGAMRGAFDNTIDSSIAGDAVTGGVMKIKNWASAKEIAKGFGKQIAGGFADEYLDGLHASFSGGMGSMMFNNYMNKNYNPEAYNAAADGMLGNMLAGVSEYMNGITDRQNLYEGFIGGTAPFTSGVISPHVIFTAHDTWNAVVKGVDGNGNRLNVGERIAQIISNPLLETYAELKDKDRRVNSTVEAINNVVAAHKEDLETASRLLYALKDNTALTTRVKISDEENAPTLLDSKDAKLYRAFTIMQALNTLGKIEGSSHAQLYNDAINTLQGLAEGTLSKEAMENEIDQFLAAKENKSILDLGVEKAREVAAERLQKNAQYFMDMKSKMDEIQSTMDKSSSMKNVDPRVKQMMLYNLVAQDDYKERLADIEKGLGVSQTNTQEMSTPNLSVRYGTEQSRTKAIEARERIDKDLVKQTEEIDKKIATADKEIERLKKSRYEKNNKEERQKEEEKLRQQETLKQSLQMQKEKVAEQRKKVEEEKKEIESLSKEGQEDRVLSEQEILQLNAQDRAFMLNEENLRNYSEKQQAVIKHTKANLKQKDPDALNKIQDAGTLAERVSDIREMHEKLLNNDKLAAEYLNAAEDRRTKTAIAEALQDGINTHYKNLEESYQNREKNPEAVSKAAKATNARVLNAYIEDHPEQKEVYQPYLDLLKYEEDIAKVIGQSEYSDEEKVNLMGSMLVMHTLSNSREEAQKFLEDVIDNSEVAAEVKEQYNSLLQKLESLGYQRDAAVLRKRQEEAEKKKKKIEEAKKAEKEAKEKADIAAEETEISQVEGSSLEEVDLFADESDTDTTEPTNLEDVDLFDEEDKVDVTDKSNKTEEESNKEAAQKQLYNQLLENFKKIGITLHNKAEMDAFLKEHGIDDVQTWIDNYYIEVKDKAEWSIINSNLLNRFGNNSSFGTIARTANNWYLCDYFGEGSFKVRAIMQIDGNEDFLNEFEKYARERNLTFRSPEDLSQSIREFAIRNGQHSNGRANVQIRRANDGNAVLDRGALDNGTYSNTEGDNGHSAGNTSDITITIKTGYDGINNLRYADIDLSEIQELRISRPQKDSFDRGIHTVSKSGRNVDLVLSEPVRDEKAGTTTYTIGRKVNGGEVSNISTAGIILKKDEIDWEKSSAREEAPADYDKFPIRAHKIIIADDGRIFAEDTNKNGRYTLKSNPLESTSFENNSQGELYGFVYNGEIYLDETKLSPNAALHEYTHLWNNMIMKAKPDSDLGRLWTRGKELMKQTSLWKQIAEDENYGKKWEKEGYSGSYLEDLIASEVHSRFVGENGERLLNDLAKEKGAEGIIGKLKQWISDVWKGLAKTFGVWTDEQLNKLTLKDWNHLVVRDFVEGVNPNKVTLQRETEQKTSTTQSTILWDRTTKETYFRNNKQGSNMSFFNEESSSKEEESKFRVRKNGNTGEFIPVDFMQIKSSDNARSAVKISEGSVSWTEAQGYELVSPGKIHQEKINGSKIWVIDKPAEIRLIKEQEVRLTSFNPNAVEQETKDSFTTDYQFDKEMSAYGIKGKLSKVVNGTAIYVDDNNQPVILLSAKGDHTFIGIFRESGSNRWSIKMENPTKDKDFKKMIASVMTQLPAYSEVYERTSISVDGLRVFAQQLQHGFVVGNDTYETSLNGADLANTFNLSQQEREDMSPVYAQEKDLESIRKILRPYLEKFGVKDVSKAVFINNEGKIRLRLPVLVKSSNSSIENQTQQSEEAQESTETPTSENSNLIEDGDEVYAKSSNLEEQAKEAEENNVSMSQTLPINNQAGVVENMEKNIPATLSGNAMSEYMAEPLVMDGELVHKRGKNPNDHMNQFYNWMAAAGVKLQNIIDDELHEILKNNPHAKIKFMAVRPEYNATNDAALKTDLLLVLDYDDSKNKGITRIHNTDNGGVIESNGKKYLIIGVAGYGSLRNKTKQALYNNLFGNNPNSSTGYGLIKRGMKSFFDTHPSDRFYVNDDITTEIVPQSLIPGYRVRKLETDEEPQFRKVSELLSDEERNPSGIKFEELYWGIQEGGGFKVVGEVKEDEIMPPRNISRNVGSAFVLIPAGNGKWLPAYLKPLFYKEMQDGVLKTKVENLIQQVVAPSYNDRLIAVSALSQIFHFDKTGDTILLRKKSAVVSLVKDGIIFKTFTLDSNFNRQEFMEAIETMNPRVNVTLSGLGKKETVKEYNEAGALMTDLAKFGTAGSSFDIFAVNESGEMIEPVGSSESQATRTSNNSELKNNNRTQVIHNGRIYREADGIYYIGKTAVTDEGLKKQLDYLKKIIKEELLPSSAEGIYDYYTLSASRENPLIIKVNRSTKEVEELSAEESKKRLQKKWEEEDIRERATAASNKLAEEEHNPDKAEATNLEDVDLGLDLEDGIEIEVNREENGEGSKDGEMVKKDEKIETRKKEKEDRNERVDNKDEMSTRKIQKKNQGGKTISFSTLIKDKKWMLPVLQVIQKKWKDVPKDFSKMQDFLRSKGIEVDSIPSNAEDIQTWIKTIEECR